MPGFYDEFQDLFSTLANRLATEFDGCLNQKVKTSKLMAKERALVYLLDFFSNELKTHQQALNVLAMVDELASRSIQEDVKFGCKRIAKRISWKLDHPAEQGWVKTCVACGETFVEKDHHCTNVSVAIKDGMMKHDPSVDDTY